MERTELIRHVLGSGLTLLRPDLEKRLTGADRRVLEQLTFLARRCCRNQGY